ncbi:WD repeat-containing protein 76 isoform X1 [Odocoileus virginianus]|uniref:WD repeat-containing protein 76 n=1 Tax=Odocoileus virginianus TaxID=9874 RepID=A0A6J0WJP1_ODOVR|nr:WD repeat-containing protein 76 isoform X2 [Odocoileus virginianus texanus]XP_020737087.1 WD repeat-containing protein 76 isoform X2 [Odocoileus virginianus texanus]XP_020737088.1 WD repeat-containing protein 76 isoform X2 [Odocoileus virginianus texanus]XP_020737089.1 WD repeat-containing protein 76 isoform X2 [Odocoileus virginianus texanus]XP_020737090.1 WD repeat-containing protein 76 isoform X2 [Odocoileus virginianus texanus]XP_020737091.1 WD repeat-containing protein 76 isoform X2 [O
MSGSRAEAEQKGVSRQRLQVNVNEYKENQNIADTSLRPLQTTVLGKIAKVYLVPFSLSSYKTGQLKRPKSLLDKNSNNEVTCKKSKKAEIKESCRRILTPKMEATSSKGESTLQKSSLDVHAESNKWQYKSPSDTVILSADTESSQEGDSDEDTTSGLDDFSELSPYERKRLKNISENANFFASLQLSESAARLREMIKKRQPSESKRKKPKKKENGTGCRRSMRLLKVDPSGVPLPAAPAQTALEVDENPLIPPGPLEMTPENRDGDDELFKGFLQTWAELSKTRSKNTEKELSSIKSYKVNLNGMVISEDTVCKVTRGSITSMAIHPSEMRTLVAAGAKYGQVGLWDLTHQPKEDGVYLFQPHSQPVSCLYFSPANPAHLLSLSYDGTLRCGDFSRAVFEEVYRDERRSFSSFDFLTEDASTLIVGHWDGRMSLVDRRTPGTSCEKLIKSSLSKIRTVHVHPVHRQYFITAGLRDIHIYDVRCLNPSRNQPLISLTEHTKSIASAYFSPLTGNRVVTTCADCKLRIFDSSCISSKIPLITTIRHNTITGRWLTRFQAVWDPKQEDCVIVGSMAHPRRVEIFHETGKWVHSFLGGECLASVCSINAMHPTQYILAGGNSSGRVHVFMN